jgi:hypothetical protein
MQGVTFQHKKVEFSFVLTRTVIYVHYLPNYTGTPLILCFVYLMNIRRLVRGAGATHLRKAPISSAYLDTPHAAMMY